MTFIRYKRRGKKWYVYEVVPYWDKELKKPRQSTKYLGVADAKGGEYQKPNKNETMKAKEKSIVDFGDSYAINEIAKSFGLNQIIGASFGDLDSIMNLICYQIVEGTAMCDCDDWREGNISAKLFPKAKSTSQDISRVINMLGKENLQRDFFTSYVERFFSRKNGILMDSTVLPNAINAGINAFGYSPEGIQKNVSCLMLIDKESKLPIYFRSIAGDIADVSTLEITLNEIGRLGLEPESAVLDAGYFSQSNVRYLCNHGIDFITRMPKSRKAFQQCVKEAGEMESIQNGVKYGERVVFIKSQKIKLYDHEVFAHVILDPGKKAKDLKLLLCEALEDGAKAEHDKKIRYCGYLILLSKKPLEKQDVLPAYYTRQSIEQIFGFAKSCNNMLPLRVHSEQSINGYLMLVFLSLIVFILLRERLQPHFTANKALVILRGLKAKVYEQEAVIQEHSRKVKDISKLLNIIMPKNLGI